MPATAELRRTPFNAIHKGLGARLVDFHGWELPIQFVSILKEHQAVRAGCGVFDVSHMGQVQVEGKDALAFLQKVNCNDVSKAGPGKAVYSHLLNPQGGVVDDVIVGCLAPGRYLTVVNSATTEKDVAWLRKNASGFDVRLEDQSERWAMLAVQGPESPKVVEALSPGAAGLPRFGVLEARLFGREAVIQRTGYTGENGFEVLVPVEAASRLWEELMTKGRSFGLAPCGLGARDTLRLEAGYVLYGQDIDDEHTPLEAGLDWVVKLDKGDFIGREALLKQRSEGLKRRLTAVRLLAAGVPRAQTVVRQGERMLGRLTSATFSPTLQTGIGWGYVSPAGLPAGERVSLMIHGREAPAEVVSTPFYKRKEQE